MKMIETTNQLFLESTDKILKGKSLAIQILGSGLGVTSLAEGTLIVFEFSRVVKMIFQLKRALNIIYLNDASYVDYLAGSVIDLQKGYLIEVVSYTPKFKQCRLPTFSEVRAYEAFSTI